MEAADVLLAAAAPGLVMKLLVGLLEVLPEYPLPPALHDICESKQKHIVDETKTTLRCIVARANNNYAHAPDKFVDTASTDAEPAVGYAE